MYHILFNRDKDWERSPIPYDSAESAMEAGRLGVLAGAGWSGFCVVKC